MKYFHSLGKSVELPVEEIRSILATVEQLGLQDGSISWSSNERIYYEAEALLAVLGAQ